MGGPQDTPHLYLQIVGKIRLTLMPLLNHWWRVMLYVSAPGPARLSGERLPGRCQTGELAC
ncbi:DUF5996 family protein [Pontibacter sp. BAB1700]|uniref:DUF5996 family protein n=1 Tax=Pontibacter TaxID=323449 RepID=UPI0035102289